MPSPHIVKFIVNADDLGASDAINEAVFRGISDGVITSATLMATGAALDAAARSAARFPRASFGVHLNLTDHQPVSRARGLAPLLDASGAFQRGAAHRARWSRSLTNAVIEEWVAQVNLVRATGVIVSHLDSHHHVHTIPGLFFALKRVQRIAGIRRVRGTWSIYDHSALPSLKLRLAKRAWWIALRRVYRTRTTSEFASLMMFLRAVREGAIDQTPWPRSLELMVHPSGAPDNADEEAAMRSGWLSTLPVQGMLASYNEL